MFHVRILLIEKNFQVEKILLLKNEIDCPQQAKAGPEKIKPQGLVHIKDGKGDKDRKGDQFLKNFQLSEIHGGVTDTIGRYLDQVFQEGDSPTDQGGQIPGFPAQILEMGIPGKGHKEVG
jgi:hypothetical protein